MGTQRDNLRTVLGWLTIAVLAVILYLGLWPYNFGLPTKARGGEPRKGGHWLMLPPNQVEWLKNGPGLHFGDYGNIFTLTNFPASAAQSEGCALEIWLEPALTEDVATLLAFSTEDNPRQLRLRQYKDSLLVIHDTPDQKHGLHSNEMAVDHVFRQQQRLLITVSSDAKGTTVFVNKERKGFVEGFRLNAGEFSGRLVFGDSPAGHESWGGDLWGLAFYPYELSEARVSADYEVWSAGRDFPAEVLSSATALYQFKERTGNTTRSSVAGAPDLVIPQRLEAMRPVFLKPFWKEFENTWEFWADVLVNILAFMPLGFFLYGYLIVGGKAKKPLLMAVAAGFLASLTIEVGQYFMPMRNSGTTDLITNTSGTGLGAVLFGIGWVRQVIESMAKRVGF